MTPETGRYAKHAGASSLDTLSESVASSAKEILEKMLPIAAGEAMRSCDAFFAYRILLGRLPLSEAEIDFLCSASLTWREFIARLLDSEEFSHQLGFLPPRQLLMTEANGFRFWFNSSDREMGASMAAGTYEPTTVRLMRKLVKPGMNCVDVGAQTGFFTCLLGTIVGSGGFVFAFEPIQASFTMLNRNVAENGLTGRVRLSPVACSDVGGELMADVASGMLVASTAGSHKIHSVALDDVIDRKIDFCKIDVEGHEPAVLKGMHKLLARDRPILVVEFNQYWLTQGRSSISNFGAMLRSEGYELWIISDKLIAFNENTPVGPLTNLNVLGIPRGQVLCIDAQPIV